MSFTSHTQSTPRHTTHYLAAGREGATPIIFVHGWPELSLSWRHQLPVFGGLGFRAIAPDMRGYGKSSVYKRHEDYALEHVVTDMIALLDSLGAEKAIWVGHDWGAPAVWAIAQHHPERCHGVANLCVPYIPTGFTPRNLIPLVNRKVYPEAEHPAGQWDYQLFYEESFDKACGAFEANIANSVHAMFRRGNPDGRGLPAITSGVRARGGWFGPGVGAPPVPRDDSVLTEEDAAIYIEALTRNGFFGPDSWYMNGDRNAEHAARAKSASIDLPVLFLHAAYDYVCETIDSDLANPMRAHCANLTEATVNSGHWMAQEEPHAVSAHLARWIVQKLPDLWPER